MVVDEFEVSSLRVVCCIGLESLIVRRIFRSFGIRFIRNYCH